MNLKSFISVLLSISFLSFQFMIPVIDNTSVLHAQESEQACAKMLSAAQTMYYEGRFDEAIDLVKECLKSNDYSMEDKKLAYKIAGQSLLAKGYPDTAKEFIRKLLEMDPGYHPTIEDEPPVFVELVDVVRTEISVQEAASVPEKKSNKKWIWIGAGGAVLLGTIAIIAGGSGGGDSDGKKPLSSPPDWP
ncbi:MAG: tetratricopeptide repeat protein [Calditrichaceae bacterium]